MPAQFFASSNTNEEDEMGDLRCALLGSFVAFAVAVPAWAGDVYVMEYSQGKKPVIVKKDSFTPADTSMQKARSRFTTESSNTSSMSSAAPGN